MIAYMQEGTPVIWHERVRLWINELSAGGYSEWTEKDLLHFESASEEKGLSIYRSFHTRANGAAGIELRHLWIEMH
jgi:hypothetical protein